MRAVLTQKLCATFLQVGALMSCSKADACTHLSDSNTRFLTISVGNLHTETLMELALITRSCDRKKEEQKKKEKGLVI